MTWESITTPYFTHDLLAGLLKNEIATVRIPGFVSPEVCKKIVSNIPAHLFNWYEYRGARENKVSKIGIVQNEHRDNLEKMELYLQSVEQANQTRQQIFQPGGDLLYYVLGFIRAAWGNEVKIAEEVGGRPYFAGLIRSIGAGALHFDWAPLDARGWAIERISAQLTWNIYFQLGAEGGETRVYRRYGQEADKQYKVPGSIHTDFSLVNGVETATILPQTGELIFFNPHNYHMIEKTLGDEQRITFSSFFGQMDEAQSLLFWS